MRFDEARALQAAPLSARHVHRLMFRGEQLLGEFSCECVLHLGEIGVTRDPIEESTGMNLQIVRRCAFERANRIFRKPAAADSVCTGGTTGQRRPSAKGYMRSVK